MALKRPAEQEGYSTNPAARTSEERNERNGVRDSKRARPATPPFPKTTTAEPTHAAASSAYERPIAPRPINMTSYPNQLQTAVTATPSGLAPELPLVRLQQSLPVGRPDLECAQRLFDEGKIEEAAKLGLPRAQGEMATRYYHGTPDVAKDFARMVYWAKDAAAGGDMEGQLRLGYAYQFALGGLEMNYVRAKQWYTMAAAQGDGASMNNIGKIYAMGGHGIAQDLVAAVDWFRQASITGRPNAQYNLANALYEGWGIVRDPVQARSWFQKAANQSFAPAQRGLGVMMINGEGGLQDFAGGCALLQEAAVKGDGPARACIESIMGLKLRPY